MCAHCGLPTPPGRRFCCPGCAAAFETIQALGLGRYYASACCRRTCARRGRSRPSAGTCPATSSRGADGTHELVLAVDGLQCGACVWLIESVLAREPAVTTGRVNMTTPAAAAGLARRRRMPTRLVAADRGAGLSAGAVRPPALAAAQDDTGRTLMRALAVAGFAAGNVMLISIGIWAGADSRCSTRSGRRRGDCCIGCRR